MLRTTDTSGDIYWTSNWETNQRVVNIHSHSHTHYCSVHSVIHQICRLKQREQVEIIKNFREGVFNTLVATCIGEEGLDIGEVDLIICFDAQVSHFSNFKSECFFYFIL
jgi:ERCC4-related helicase